MEMNIDPLIFDGDTNVSVVVHKGDKLQNKTATPSDEAQTIRPDEGFFGLSSVTVEAIEEGSAATPDTEITATPSITVGADGLITATVNESESITPDVESGYVSEGTAGTVSVSGSASFQLATQGASSITPTESAQTAVPSGKYTTGDTTVNAIPSDYVGSGVTRRSGTDLSASGATVSVPSGFYAESASKAVASGAEGIPSASKGAVSNHAVSITPSVTNTEGYINGGTKTGDPITVTASELDSGSKSITANGTAQDVVGYAEVNVNVPNSYTASDEGKVVSSGALVAQTARSISANGTYDTTTNNSVSVSVPSQSPVINPLTVTENGTYTAPSGVDGYSPVTVNVSGGGGGLEYEEGTWTPASDIASDTISFSNSHTTAPTIYFISPTSNMERNLDYSNFAVYFYNWEKIAGGIMAKTYGDAEHKYASITNIYGSNTGAAASYTYMFTHSSDEVSADKTYPAYWATNTRIRAGSYLVGNYKWRTGYTYKWKAIWA